MRIIKLIIKKHKAFTLVEMAIVITIIGLLIAGVTTGVKILKNARVTATVMQINTYGKAMKVFEKTYGGLPGDLLDADKKIPGCKPSGGRTGCELSGSITNYICSITYVFLGTTYNLPGSPFSDQCLNHTECTSGYTCTETSTITQMTPSPERGDGIIGAPDWDMYTFRSSNLTSSTVNQTDAETVLFWYELKQAGLITGVTDAGLRGGKSKFGKSLPAAELGGGFWVGNSNGANGGEPGSTDYYNFTGRPTTNSGIYPYNILGTVLALVKVAKGSSSEYKTFNGPPMVTYSSLSTSQRKNILTPHMAANIDRKLDDGKPDTGNVQAFGWGASCYGGAIAPFAYNELITNKDCGIYALIHQ